MSSVTLKIRGIGHIPSFKNHKRAILDSQTGHQRTLTEPKIKERMQRLENAILFELYSASQTGASGIVSECLKPLQTLLSGLCDDSIKEIPSGSWDVEYVPKGEEGLDILIEQI